MRSKCFYVILVAISCLASGMTASKASYGAAKIRFKSVTEQDLPLLFAWFKEPQVKQWWPVPDKQEDFFKEFLPRIRLEGTLPYLVLCEDIPFGYLQSYPFCSDKHAWWPKDLQNEHTIGTDQFIGDPAYLGKGYGKAMLSAFIDYLSRTNKTIKTVIVDPDPSNSRAIACYEKVGFKKVGAYQLPLGPVLLMRYDLCANTLSCS